MRITNDLNINNFKFWSGAKDLTNKLTYSELNVIQENLEELYPDGLTDTQLNDLFWFDDEFICELIGVDVDEVYGRE